MERGDHIITPRLGYTHHGLYLGKNQVIHYTGFSNGQHQGVIAITSLEEFCQGEGFTVQTYPVRMYSHEESADRAYSRLGEDWYDVLLNNCEHFVTWCVLGIHSSHQVNRLIAAAALTRKLLAAPKDIVTTAAILGINQRSAEAVTQGVIAHAATASTSASSAGTICGLVAGGGAAASTATTGVAVTSFAAVSAAPVVATIGLGVAVGYGIKSLVDWLMD